MSIEKASKMEYMESKTIDTSIITANKEEGEVVHVKNGRRKWKHYKTLLIIDLAVQVGLFVFLCLLMITTDSRPGATAEESFELFLRSLFFAVAFYIAMIGFWNFVGNTVRLAFIYRKGEKLLSWRLTYEIFAIIYLLIIFADSCYRFFEPDEWIFLTAPFFALSYTVLSFRELKKLLND